MKARIRFLCSTVGTILAFLFIGHGTVDAQGKPIPINIGWQPGTCYACYVARDRNLFEQVGLQPNYVKFNAGPPMFSAFQTDSIDVSWTGVLPAIIGAGQGVPLKIIAIEAATRNAIIVKRDGPIKKVTELAGKKIGSVMGSGAYFAMAKILDMNKLNDKYTFVNMQLPSLIPAFVKSDVDALVIWEPWASRAVAEGGIRIADEFDIFGRYPGNVIIARTGWLAENPEAVRRYLKALHMAQAIYAKEPSAAVKAMAKEVGIPEAMSLEIFTADAKPTFERQVKTGDPYSIIGPDAIQVQIFQTIADFFSEKGITKTRVDMRKVFDSAPLADYMKSADR